MECHTRFSPVQCTVAVCKIDEMHSDSFVVASVLFAGAQVVLSGGVKKTMLITACSDVLLVHKSALKYGWRKVCRSVV